MMMLGRKRKYLKLWLLAFVANIKTRADAIIYISSIAN